MAVSARLIKSRSEVTGGQGLGRVQGIDELTKKLRDIPAKMRSQVLRRALAAGARRVQADAKQGVPVLSSTSAAKAPYRRPGTVRDAIRVRTSKEAKRDGDVGVFVNVKPLKKSQRSARNPRDPFYWRFIEFGTKKYSTEGFLRPAAKQLGEALKIFERALGKWFVKIEADGKVVE
jgi:HK97 gp10 family phage protein